MNAPSRPPLSIASMTADPVVVALRDRMIAEPWRINDALTGAAFWPPDDTLTWLYNESVDRVRDRIDLEAEWGPQWISMECLQLVAARDALAIICNEQDEKRQAEERRMEDGPNVGAAR